MAKIVCIIQARRGSTRLPDKVLLPLNGKPVIKHVIERCRAIAMVDEVILATVDDPYEDALAEVALESGASVFRGSENDVLDRYYRAAKKADADYVMRVTADCPLIDSDVCNSLIISLMSNKADYGGNGNFPHGLDCEFFTMALLKKAHEEAFSLEDREHVTLWMKRRADIKKVSLHPMDGNNYSKLRWTIDYPEDYELLKKIFEQYVSGDMRLEWLGLAQSVIDRPDLMNINAEQKKLWNKATVQIYENAKKGIE